ncbi:trehalose-6-phosphate synthase [Dissulfurirhabdus thermomarina]|uniref:Trehalose-6-phosphate synthase n=1 Tax=Dissulfurirhabdus thermomarina TaxID=1765737 RepID=A0A6N9TMW2_DISTH|nr:trehalose-6-phosphate synthase [Dissulfurirhabdus thermomarina]NDY42631.1 trehalose-6-phosphate synthase [Dissulfurirhabdus thermomarina]NMX23070.1 trehalose-6-phosphate synthase [Dissulfurirhabdus thermomarina]
MNQDQPRLVAVSNRLPVSLVREGDQWTVRPGSGGLVTALAPVLRNRGGLWIGWCGATEGAEIEALMGPASREAGYSLHPVTLTADEVRDFYYGFSNEIIWPLFHDLQVRCNFQPRYWHAYQEANRKFAAVAADFSRPSDFIWVHDYHLMQMARALKAMGIQRRTGFFLHIPFPPLDIFLKLPWRAEILSGLLEYDLIGFQTQRDRRNFLSCVHHLMPQLRVRGRGGVVRLAVGEREVRVGAFPISIDFDEFARGAGSQEVADCAWFLHERFPERQVILGVDRLDYTKGIPERLFAFRNALERFPDLHERVNLVLVVVPSREEAPEYRALKAEIDRLVGEVNGRFTRSGWVPIHYYYRSLSRTELLAYYRLSEIALVTPLKDGMNLVCKEYCACKLEEDGVLILSEFAGAVSQLHRDALLVNPYDMEGVANAIHQAFRMDTDERRQRMHRLRAAIRRRDIYWWVNTFLRAALAKDLADFPPVEDYMPQMDITPGTEEGGGAPSGE